MARLPKWYADTMEILMGKLYHQVCIDQINELNEKYLSIRFRGDFSACKFTTGQVVQFRLNQREFRHYTPSRFDTKKGICEIIFYRHHKGLGAKWVENLVFDQELKLMGPGGKIEYQDQHDKHFIFGDETSVGLVQSMKTQSDLAHTQLIGVIETAIDPAFTSEIMTYNEVKIVPTDAHEKANNAIVTLDKMIEKEALKSYQFYLTGNAKSIQNFRNFLKGKGVNPKQIATEPYWVEGKSGL